ncbi:hypothetical protein CSUB01_11497, partial [Colletotrichum sublineola]
MAAHNWVYEITSDDEDDGQHSDISFPDSELNHGTNSPRSQLCPIPGALPFLNHHEWAPGQSYDEQPPRWMLYTMQWKLTLNNRKAVEQTEQNLPIVEIVNSKKKTYETSATTVIMSVPNDRSEDKVTKHFPKLQIDWSVVERQLQGWSQLLRAGKRLKLFVQIDYVECAPTGRPAGRGATATGLAERSARIDAEQEATGEVDPWRQVYQLMRCPGAPCDNGKWCWQDGARKMHHKLLDHHMRELVRWVQQGHQLVTHDDVPEEIRAQLYAQEQQGRKRKRQNSGLDSTNHVPWFVNRDRTAMEVTSSTLLSLAHNLDTFFQKCLEIGPDEALMIVPDLPDKVLQLPEKVLNGDNVWRIRRRVYQHHSCCTAHF